MGIKAHVFLRLGIIFLLIRGMLSIRNVRLMVPEASQRGSRQKLICLYDLENDEVLYSLKWYRGDREFCRYSPRDVPPLKVFHIPGLDVDRDASDSTQVVLDPVTQVANGHYTCEVSADAPSFQTHQVRAHMHVVDLPDAGPAMYGMKRRYKAGMKLKLECVSRNSMPAANLSFFVNNEPAQTQHVWHRVEAGEKGQLWTAYSTIQFIIQKHHFADHKIKIRCTAIIYTLYQRSVEKSAEEERVRTTPSTLWEPQQAVVYPIHRHKKNSTSDVPGTASNISKLFFLITFLLPTALR